jgi:hypothetical protein
MFVVCVYHINDVLGGLVCYRRGEVTLFRDFLKEVIGVFLSLFGVLIS